MTPFTVKLYVAISTSLQICTPQKIKWVSSINVNELVVAHTYNLNFQENKFKDNLRDWRKKWGRKTNVISALWHKWLAFKFPLLCVYRVCRLLCSREDNTTVGVLPSPPHVGCSDQGRLAGFCCKHPPPSPDEWVSALGNILSPRGRGLRGNYVEAKMRFLFDLLYHLT